MSTAEKLPFRFPAPGDDPLAGLCKHCLETPSGMFRKPSKEEISKELAEARTEWNNACEVDSGDEFSDDALSAAAARLHHAEEAAKKAGLL